MRKSIFATFTAAVAVAAALLLTGCERAIDMTGRPVSFSAVAMDYVAGTRSDLPDTRVVYGDISETKTQAIEWIKGDLITIHSPQCTRIQSDGDKQTCEYIVTEVGSDDASQAGIGLPYYIAEGLQWNGEGAYTFYALYPGMDTEGMTGNAIVAGEHVTATGTIPQIQDGTASTDSETGNTVIAPDMRNMYMTARTTVKAEDAGGDVELDFKPLTTAVEFTITNRLDRVEDGSAITISSISLNSENHALNGGFKVYMDDPGHYESPYNRPRTVLANESVTDAYKTVTIDFGDSPVTVAYGKTLTFTFFLNPGNATDVDDLTFSIVGTNVDAGQPFSRRTRLATTDGSIEFPVHQKTRIEGLLLPFGAQWIVTYGPEVESWLHDGGPIVPMPEMGYGQILVTSWESGTDTDVSMRKYEYTMDVTGETSFDHRGTAHMTDGASTLAVSSRGRYGSAMSFEAVWNLEYLDVSDGTWKAARSGEQVGGLVTMSMDGLDNGASLIGKGAGTVSMTVTAAEEPEGSTHIARLLAADVQGSESAPYDLSMHNIYGVSRTRAKTANCYIVRSRGWYAFPLVYGNAIDDNVAPAGFVNVNAYNPGGETDPTADILTRFRNSRGQGIRQPYMEDDLETTASDWTAEVLWQDAAFIDGCQVMTASAASARGLTASACGYVMFRVNDAICQGNALIAVKDGSGNVLWSWHIWITDNELDMVSFSNASGQTVNMLPVNLGWVDADDGDVKYYEGGSVRFRIVQEGSQIVKEFIVARRPESTVSHASGTSTYYQWGRKDPFRSGSFSTVSASDAPDLAYSVTHPTTFVRGGGSYYVETIQSAPARYLNLWSALNKGLGTNATNYAGKTIKTVYDPCPPGFQIPHGTAFAGLTATGSTFADGGWYFRTGAGDETNFFPAGGLIGSGSGTLTDTGNTGSYWTSVPGTDGTGMCLHFSDSEISVAGSEGQGGALTVRPVMEQDL